MSPGDVFNDCEGFEWDEGNLDKNWRIHQVHFWECEEVFFNEPIVVESDPEHSKKELGFYSLGKTNAGRLLFIVFTIRGKLIRIIWARDMTRKEGVTYKSYEEKDSGI